jgi:hypothetical protein
VQVTTVDDSRDQIARVAPVRQFTVEHAILADTQPAPRSVFGDLLDVEVRGDPIGATYLFSWCFADI